MKEIVVVDDSDVKDNDVDNDDNDNKDDDDDDEDDDDDDEYHLKPCTKAMTCLSLKSESCIRVVEGQ